MAEKAGQSNQPEQAEPTAEESQAPTGGPVSWRRLLTGKWIVVLVVASLIIHGIGFAYSRLAHRGAPPAGSPEVTLGAFRFEADQGEAGPVAGAEFSLHIALLEQVDRAARSRLEAHRFRVQQGVEELLRQAHGGDFDDPNLGELKRRLQEQINEILGMRAIADVIITDLKLQPGDQDLGSLTDTKELVPWVEEPSG